MDSNNSKKTSADKISEDITVEIKAENRASANSSSEYEFVTETIKKKPLNKKRALRKVIHSIGMGVVTGLVACIIFVVVEPILYSRMHPEQIDHVSIPQDEQQEVSDDTESLTETERAQLEDAKSSEDSDSIKVDQVKDSEDESSEENNEEDKVKDNSEADDASTKKTDEESTNADRTSESDNKKIENSEDGDSEDTSITAANQPILIDKEVGLDDYKQLYRKISEVANVTRRSLTKVKGVTDSTDWFKNTYESSSTSTGIIVADNGKELLIITNSKKVTSSKEIEVTFCDNRSYKGTVKKADPNTNLVVVAVQLNDIDELTKNSYAKAVLGNSMLPTLPGTPVIAVGAPLGIEDSMTTGIITSNTKTIEHTDSNIRLITTDMYGSTEGSGVIVDLEGRVLGIIFQGGTSADMKNLVHAYAISDIKLIIEKLSNGQDEAYLGIIGGDVSKYAVEELSVPQGAYVKQVVVDSPAMDGGIQNGDIIVKLGTSDIKSFSDYTDAINKSQPGDIAVVTVMRPDKDEYTEFSYEITLEAIQ